MKQVCLCLITVLLALPLFSSGSLAQEYTLKDLSRQALKNSERIKYAEENLYLSQMLKKKARAVLMPRATAFGTYNRFSEDKFTSAGLMIQPQESGTWGVRAEQAFSLSLRELNALKMAGQSIEKSEFDLDTAKEDFILAVASSYYDALKARKAVEITAANVERLTQYRYSVERRVKVGELTKTALLRAEGELSGAQADYLRAINALKLCRAALIRLTGIEENFRLKNEENLPDKMESLEYLRQSAADFRADLKSSDRQIRMAVEQIKYARGAFWPSAGLFAVYNGADQSPVSATLNRESILAGVSLSFPFFEGGLRLAELNEAKAKERQALWLHEDLKKNVDIELQSACLDLETQKGTLKFLQDQLVFAEDNFNGVLRQYDNGLATSLDVMDANTLLLSSEKNAAEALYGYQLAYLKVKKSSGTLLLFIEKGH